MQKLILTFILTCFTFSAYSQSEISDLEKKVSSSAQNTMKVDLLNQLFDLYFTKAPDKNLYKDQALETGNEALTLAEKLSYSKGQITSYKNLAAYHKHFKNNRSYLKYEFKYQQNKKELEKIIAQESELKEKARIQRLKEESDRIKQEALRKQKEIEELEKDKDLNKDLIEQKKRELESTNQLLSQSMHEIEEKESTITQAQNTIEQQSVINENLKYQNEILESEKKIADLRRKAEESKNMFYLLIGSAGMLLALLLVVISLYMRKTQAKLRKQNQLIAEEKSRSDELLLNILPYETAQELKQHGQTKAQSFDNVTVFFSDFKDFTRISEQLSPSELVEEIDVCFKAFDKIIEKYAIEKIKTVGDAYICVAGLSNSDDHSPEEIISAAIEIREFIRKRVESRKKQKKPFFEVRIGVHTGPVVAGIVGFKKFAYDIWGDTVNTAARMEENSSAGEINISAETYNLIKSKFSCTHRGKIEAKNKGEIDMYFVHERIES